MILWCAVAGLVVGSWLNWLADYLPRFSADHSARHRFASAPRPKFTFALASLLAARVLHKNPAGEQGRRGAGDASAIAQQRSGKETLRRPSAVSPLNLAIELLMAFLFTAAWVRFGWSPNLLLLASLDSFFVLIALIDYKYRLILNVLIFPALAATLGFAVLTTWLAPFAAPGMFRLPAMLVGGAFGLAIFWFAAWIRPGTLGFGDVKLAALIGLVLGFPYAVCALLIGVLAGGVAVIVLVLTRQADLQARIPYAPFLCLGAVSAFGFAPLLTII